MLPDLPKYHEWRAAEAAAQAAEQQLYAAMLQLASDLSSPGLREQVRSTQALRRQAHGLFSDAMLEIKDRAETLSYRHVQPAERGDAGVA